MPMYEYQCEACGHRFEKIQKFSDAPLEICPNCGEKKLQKLLSSPAIQFKGSGWYITDYARKGSAGTEGSKSTGDSKSSDSKASDSTTEKTSSETKSATPSSTTTTKDS